MAWIKLNLRTFVENMLPHMKNLFVGIVVFAFAAVGGGTLQAQSQRLIVGERAPELKIAEWLAGTPPANGKPRLIEFFHSSSRPSADRLTTLDAWAKKYGGRLSIVVIAREPKDKIMPLFRAKPYAFSVALDEAGKTFSAYNVQFIPFSVVIDGKGRLRWFGNSSDLTEAIIDSNL